MVHKPTDDGGVSHCWAPKLLQRTLKVLFDALVYALLSLGLYGICTLALAMLVLPAAYQVDMKEVATELVSEYAFLSGARSFAQSLFTYLVTAFAPVWLPSLPAPSDGGPLPLAAPQAFPILHNDGAGAYSYSYSLLSAGLMLLASLARARR